MRAAVFAAALSVAVAAHAHETDYAAVGVDEARRVWFVDRASIARKDGLVRAWYKVAYGVAEPDPATGRRTGVVLALQLTDCRRGLVGVKERRLFDEDGAFIDAYGTPRAKIEWERATERPFVQTLVRTVCALPIAPASDDAEAKPSGSSAVVGKPIATSADGEADAGPIDAEPQLGLRRRAGPPAPRDANADELDVLARGVVAWLGTREPVRIQAARVGPDADGMLRACSYVRTRRGRRLVNAMYVQDIETGARRIDVMLADDGEMQGAAALCRADGLMPLGGDAPQ